MPKAHTIALLDADGVLIKKYPEYFSGYYARTHDVSLAAMMPFYQNEFRLCQTGAADLKEEIAVYLPQWKWEKGVDAFLEYWFTTDVVPDDEALTMVDAIRARGVRCYLTSDQEKYRARYIVERLGLADRLDGLFFSCDVGHSKSQPEFYTTILDKLHAQPDDVVFIDDDMDNIAVAKEIGIDARFFEHLDQLKAL